jgi:regulator of replication initiation timing
MAHPLIEQFCKIHTADRMNTIFFRRMQRELRDVIQPMLDERDRLLVENAELRAEVEKTSKRKPKAETVTA